MSVTTLKPKTIPPYVVLDTLKERLPDIEAIFVVTIENDEPVTYASGDLNKLCIASVTLHQLAVDYLKGNVVDE